MAGGAELASWAGLERQPEATKDAIKKELQRLKDSGKESITIVMVGKSGVGKSSTVNTLLGERVRPSNPFQPETVQAVEVKRQWEGVELCVVDTPGLLDSGDLSEQALKSILRFLVGRVVDVLLYVDRLDVYAVDDSDRVIIRALTAALGKEMWRASVIVLTRSQLVPSDGRSYADFVAARAKALQGAISKESGIKAEEVPVRQVENVDMRCRANEAGDKILPDGAVWLPRVYEAVAEAALAPIRRRPIDESTVNGPDPNRRFKLLIPFVLLAEVFLVFLPLHRGIESDKLDERRNRPRWEVEAEEYRRSGSAQMARKLAAEYAAQQNK